VAAQRLVPVLPAHPRLQFGFVGSDVLIEFVSGAGVQAQVGVGVIAEGEAGAAPELEPRDVFGVLFEFFCADFGRVRLFQSLEDALRDVGACQAEREGAMGWQVVDRDSDLLGERGRGEKQ
jgi:hypothetical protein